MRINLDYFIILCDLYKRIPALTPKRLNIFCAVAKDIFEEFETENNSYCKEDILVDIKGYESNELFKIEDLALIAENLSRFTQMDSIKSKTFERILLPTTFYCCGKLIKIEGRYFAKLSIFTEHGVIAGRSYHGTCKCGKSFYYGYIDDKVNNTRTFDSNCVDFLLFTSNIAFSINLLTHTDFQISIGVVSFQSAAEIYNNIWPGDCLLSKQCLENAWFVFKIIKYVRCFDPWPRNAQKELDVETLCDQVYEYIRSEIDKKWINHVCSEVGCKERYIVMDGNEKLYRSICGAEKSKIIGVSGDVNSYDLCIRNPIRGNQHTQSSKFCFSHLDGKKGEGRQNIDLRPVTRSF